jgi:hypothetical protein
MSYQFLGPNLVRVYNESSSIIFKPSQFCTSVTSKRDPQIALPITSVTPFVIVSLYSGGKDANGGPVLNLIFLGLDQSLSDADASALNGDVYTAVNDYLESIA